MATLQKFKFLARQCAVANSPIRRSPSSSPVVHLRRRKILRMLLGNGRSSSSSSSGRTYSRRFLRRDESTTNDHHRRQSDDNRTTAEEKTEDKDHHQHQQHQKITVRYKLKDLFVSSPSPPPSYQCIGNSNARKVYEKEDTDTVKQPLLPAATSTEGRDGELVVTRRTSGGGQLRPLSATVRQRLLRRVWRPVLMAIPECQE